MEKWLQSKGNPYSNHISQTKQIKKVSLANPFLNNSRKAIGKPKRLTYAYYGKPVQLFKDSDKDGVANVFDCKPFNKRKQDVLSPMSGGNPMHEMLQRKEYSRQQGAYRNQLEEAQRIDLANQKEYLKLQEDQLAELRRLSNVEVIDQTKTIVQPIYVGSSGGSSSGKSGSSGLSAADYKEYSAALQKQADKARIKAGLPTAKEAAAADVARERAFIAAGERSAAYIKATLAKAKSAPAPAATVKASAKPSLKDVAVSYLKQTSAGKALSLAKGAKK